MAESLILAFSYEAFFSNSLTDFPRTLCFVLIFVVQFSMTSLPALADSSIIIPRSSLFVNPFFEFFLHFFSFFLIFAEYFFVETLHIFPCNDIFALIGTQTTPGAGKINEKFSRLPECFFRETYQTSAIGFKKALLLFALT